MRHLCIAIAVFALVVSTAMADVNLASEKYGVRLNLPGWQKKKAKTTNTYEAFTLEKRSTMAYVGITGMIYMFT